MKFDQLKKKKKIHNITHNFSMLHELNISLNSKKIWQNSKHLHSAYMNQDQKKKDNI